MKQDETEQLNNIQKEIDGLTALYLAIMNGEYKTMTFSITLNEDKKSNLEGGGYAMYPSFILHSMWRTEQDDEEWKTKEKNPVMTSGFSITPDNALALLEDEIKRLVTLRSQIINQLKATYRLPTKKKEK